MPGDAHRWRGPCPAAGRSAAADALPGAPGIGADVGADAGGALRKARELPQLCLFTQLAEAVAPPADGYLGGALFAVKDLIGVAGMQRTGGSDSETRDPFPRDAPSVAALRRHGGVVIGLANLHELAFGASCANPVFGTVVNPAAPDCTPGGSSGGSAAAMAAGVVPVALGTDTGGSIRIPAACCGVVGFKPSYDAVSREGVIEMAATLDHVGPIGRTVLDCAYAFAALTDEPEFPALADRALTGLRVARLGGHFEQPLDPDVRFALDSACERMRCDRAQVATTTIEGAELASALQFVTIRCTPSGARVCMYRHTRADGTRDILKVADYDPRGVIGMTLHEARERAGELARLAGAGNNLRAMLNERAAANIAAEEAVAAAKRKAEQGSLASLFRVYVGTLQGRQSHYDAQSIFQLHVSEPFPKLAARPAAQVKAEELRDVLFWRRVETAADSPARDALMACMYLGGQRPTQLLRLTPQLVDVSGATVTLLEPKGRNRHANPRRHVLPIHEDLTPVIRRRMGQTEAIESPLFSTNGRAPLRKETVAVVVGEIEAAMLAARELERGPFSMRDLRRTAETHMAALGISSDVRAQIQSHGLGGIQARHYDRHDYMPEKRTALGLWARRFTNAQR